MKRFHIHIAVEKLTESIDFYSKLFGQAPEKERPEYAKWMLESPRINFAISARGHSTGINHLGIQVESEQELAELKQLAEVASANQTIDQEDAACCYAKSEKHWTLDPQGIAWEHFYTMADSETYGEDVELNEGACCIPTRASDDDTAEAGCCIPNEASNDSKTGKSQSACSAC